MKCSTNASKKKSLAIIRNSLKLAPIQCNNTKKQWQEIAFERMGINPGICNCCGGKMVIIESLTNHFRERAPPNRETEKILSDCKYDF